MSKIWPHATKQSPCPICGKPDYCTFGDRAVLCKRVESNHPHRNGGWFHHYGDKNGSDRPFHTSVARHIEPLRDAQGILDRWRSVFNQYTVKTFSECLGVAHSSLEELHCAFDGERGAFGFPMRDDSGEAIGIRMRNWNGDKWAVKGSRAGLFYSQTPEALELLDQFNAAFICEGPTDAAAILTLGFFPIGRPNCASGNELVAKLLKRLKIHRAVIVSDFDEIKTGGKRPGLVGAKQLKKDLGIPSVVWLPVAPCKDVREFLREGGTRQLILDDLRNSVWTRQ